jgi:hypothetical protein
MSFKFRENFLKASVVKKNFETAKDEWIFLYYEKRDELDRVCICCREIKHINFLFNEKNGRVIICGDKCVKKVFGETFKENSLKNNLLHNVLMNCIKGEYVEIDFEYQFKLYMDQFLESIKTKTMKEIEEILNHLKKVSSCFTIVEIVGKIETEIDIRREEEKRQIENIRIAKKLENDKKEKEKRDKILSDKWREKFDDLLINFHLLSSEDKKVFKEIKDYSPETDIVTTNLHNKLCETKNNQENRKADIENIDFELGYIDSLICYIAI